MAKSRAKMGLPDDAAIMPVRGCGCGYGCGYGCVCVCVYSVWCVGMGVDVDVWVWVCGVVCLVCVSVCGCGCWGWGVGGCGGVGRGVKTNDTTMCAAGCMYVCAHIPRASTTAHMHTHTHLTQVWDMKRDTLRELELPRPTASNNPRRALKATKVSRSPHPPPLPVHHLAAHAPVSLCYLFCPNCRQPSYALVRSM